MSVLARLLPFAFLLCPIVGSVQAQNSRDPLPVRIGILAYEDSSPDLPVLKTLAQDAAKNGGSPLQLKFALGNYSEILHWMRAEKLDAAVANIGIFQALETDPAVRGKWRYSMSQVSLPSETGVVCFSRKGVGPTALSNLGDAELVLVDPYSVSGSVVPLAALKRLGITPLPEQIRFSYSHSNSMRMVALNPAPSIGCVWRAVFDRQPHDSIEPFDAAPLADFVPPNAVVLVRSDSNPGKVLSDFLATRGGFATDPNWEKTYANAEQWRAEAGTLLHGTDKASLDDLVTSLSNDSRTQLSPPRLALVLAGGGAKCSFQVGAMRALEESLSAARERLGIKSLDVSLVVGTSGGAINAIPAAMALADSEAGYKDLVDAWLDLDQREILLPSKLVRGNLSLWVFSVESLLFALLGSLTAANWYRRPFLPAKPAFVLGVVQIGVGLAPIRPWELLGFHPALHKVWLWFSYGVLGAGTLHIAAAFVAFFLAGRMNLPNRKTCAAALIFLSVLLPMVQAWTMLWHQETLIEGSGIERSVLRSFSKIVANAALRKGDPISPLDQGESAQEQLSALGKSLLGSGLLKRDLVFATSPLTSPDLKLPGEYYWYLPSGASTTPTYGDRGVPLKQYPNLFFDVLMGSGSIYPVFPARRIKDFPTNGVSVDLVDGSFAHRSPLEAATLWGATHLIVIEASTAELPERGPFLTNLGAALSYLYDEAQLTDVRARSEVKVFTLTPTAPHIGLLDFADNLISEGIAKGYREARGDLPGGVRGSPAFTVSYGDPRFWTP